MTAAEQFAAQTWVEAACPPLTGTQGSAPRRVRELKGAPSASVWGRAGNVLAAPAAASMTKEHQE